MIHFSRSGFSLLITALPEILLRAFEQFTGLIGYVWRIACISYYERKSLGFLVHGKQYWKYVWIILPPNSWWPHFQPTWCFNSKLDPILRPRLRQWHWQNQEWWKSEKCNWLRSPLQTWTPVSLPPESGLRGERTAAESWGQDGVWDWVSQLQPAIFFNQHHLLSDDSLHERRGTRGCREMKADLRVQPSVCWPISYCEFTNDEVLVGVLLSGSEFICSVGILGATFSF